MSANDGVLTNLLARVRESSEAVETIEILRELDTLGLPIDDEDIDTAYAVRLEGLEQISIATTGDRHKATETVLQFLIPALLGPGLDIARRSGRRRLQELLVQWIDEFDGEARSEFRNAILDALLQALASSNPEPAIWAIGALGYRRDDVLEALFATEQRHPDSIGDAALSVISTLGLTPELQDKVRKLAHVRVPLRHNVPLWGTLLRTADHSSIQILSQNWLSKERTEEDVWGASHSALRIFAEIADREFANTALQRELWTLALAGLSPDTSAGITRLLLGSDLAPKFNTPEVIPTLIGYAYGSDLISGHQRYLIGLRAGECVRPAQLEGWSHIPVHPELSARLRSDAVRDSGMTERMMSSDARQKEMVWTLSLLYLGWSQTQDWAQEALECESGAFVQKHILDILAHIKIENMPRLIRSWIIEPFNELREQNDVGWAPRIAAIDVARSAANTEAFEALLHPGFSIQGHLPTVTANALAHVAKHLAIHDPTVIDKLLDRLAPEATNLERMAAIHATSVLAKANLISSDALPLLEGLLEREIDPYEKAAAISAIASIYGTLPNYLLKKFSQWVVSDDDQVGWQSAVALAESGLLLQEQNALAALGLAWGERGITYSPNSPRKHWLPEVLALLYCHQTDKVAPVIAEMIRTENWFFASALLDALTRAIPEGTVTTSKEIIEALDARMVRELSDHSAELSLPEYVAMLAPQLLFNRKWNVLQHFWMPQARAALGNVISQISASKADREIQISYLHRLTRDAHYAVRRVGYRGLAAVSPQSLEELCGEWVADHSLELRKRAAEAHSWLPYGNHEWANTLTTDAEPAVREAFVKAHEERREREWAAGYLSVVLTSASNSDDILPALPFGEALKRVGDDAARDRIRECLQQPGLAPHKDYWLRNIDTALKKRWEEVIKKWPGVWADVTGKVETGSGSLERAGSSVAVRYILWFEIGSGPHGAHEWGGRLFASDTDRIEMTDSDAILHLQDGRQGSVLIVRIDFQGATALGNGGFPATS